MNMNNDNNKTKTKCFKMSNQHVLTHTKSIKLPKDRYDVYVYII